MAKQNEFVPLDINMKRARRVLLADPLMFSHSVHYYQAALASAGYEETEFTVVTSARDDSDRERLLEMGTREPRLKVPPVTVLNRNCEKRLEAWDAFGRGMRKVEKLLRCESFDLVAYLYLDLALVFFASPAFKPFLQAHYRKGIAGLILRDNGLRPPPEATVKGRMRKAIDRFILSRALRSGAFRKLAFLDHWCAERARNEFDCRICGPGVDPVFHHPYDARQARARLGIGEDDFAVLFFGTISDRKSVVECLSIMREAPLPEGKTAIIIAGPVEAAYRERLNQELEATGRKYKVIRADAFIKDGELAPYFAAASCVVCVYKEFTGSSNVLLHGASFGKPALVSPGGAMEDAVRRYGLGEVVTITNPKEFATAICNLARMEKAGRESLAERAVAYARSMEASRFMSQFEYI